MDVVKSIAEFNAGRDPERLQLKLRKMRSDPFVFLRGTSHLYYQRVPRSGLFKRAPLTWSCGDLHLENFGSYKGDNRLAYFDINDFDEGCLAPASWDAVRMLTSIQVGARSLGCRAAEVRRLASTFVDRYGDALAAGKAYWADHRTAQGLVGHLLDGLRDRPRQAFLDARTRMQGKRRVIDVRGQRALPASPAQRQRVQAFMRDFAASQATPGFFKVLDVARRVAGTGSLGVDRYVILIHGKGRPDGHYLLDLKEALPSTLAARIKVKQPRWASEAERVVEVQRRMQAVPMAFLQPVTMDGRPYVLRGLQPSEDRVMLDRAHHTYQDIEAVIHHMAHILAWAQLRSSGRQGAAIADELIAFAAGEKWRARLLEAADDSARQTLADARLFDEAFDDGYFESLLT